MPSRRKVRLYDADHAPVREFNRKVKGWLEGELSIREHKTPVAFDGLRSAYAAAVSAAISEGVPLAGAHAAALSELTKLLFGHDLAAELGIRLRSGLVNVGGFRTTLSQGVAKNVGENFVNVIAYALADTLKHQDDVLVDKGIPPNLRECLTLHRVVPLKTGDKLIAIPIETDLTVFSRSDPTNAIIISAKTRLKEVFHIGTMWKLLFDSIGDTYCERKWGFTSYLHQPLSTMLYVFATADMVAAGGRNTQGPDVERAQPRNLIAMDASFFDYVFVSKTGIPHVENSIQLGERGALFHELGCMVELIRQKFGIEF